MTDSLISMENIRDPKERIKDFKEVALGLTKEQAEAEVKRCLNCPNPMCSTGCPSAQKIPKYIKAIKEGKLDEAMKIILEDNCLPCSAGRVCPAFCEKKCVLGIRGKPMSIRLLKRYVADNIDWSKVNLDKKPSTGKKIAIIGSGPAGLATAFYLAREGHDITVFESLSYPGGMMYYGIPRYRLPLEALKKDLNMLEKLGVKFVLNHKIVDIKKLKESYDIVFISTGASKPSKLDIPGAELAIEAVKFLLDVNSSKKPKIGKKVAVVGGGNVAIDAARTAVRLGADVTLVYRKEKKDMTASPNEIREAEEEDVKFVFQSNPIKITSNNGKVTGLECSTGSLDVDTVIFAVGQKTDVDFLKGFDLNERGLIKVNENYETNVKGIYAGGDVILGPATVIQALATGKKAALVINQYLNY